MMLVELLEKAARDRRPRPDADHFVLRFDCELDLERMIVRALPAGGGPTRGPGDFTNAVVWDTRSSESLDGELVVGLGTGASVVSDRAGVEAAVTGMLRRFGSDAKAVRAFGAIPFDDRAGAECPPRFAVPRWTFSKRGTRAVRVTLVLDARAQYDLERAAEEARELEASLRRSSRPPPMVEEAAPARVVDDGEKAFSDLVVEATAAIGAGILQKVVVARRAVVRGAPAVGTVLPRLAGAAGCVRYGLVTDTDAFVGASPEVLVAVGERGIRTEAVAGSEPRRGADLAEVARLLLRDKDRREHKVVVDAIRASLAQAGVELQPLEETRVRTLTHLHHLVTSIAATPGPKGRVNALSLARALHPTPAMGGSPTEAALAFLRLHESFARGYYASPFGWVDGRGHGAFVVGIRSVRLTKDVAHAYAGAGIVTGSTPAAEVAETKAKLRGILDALGVPQDTKPSRSRGGSVRARP